MGVYQIPGEGDRAPCCMVTEGEWTWFGSTLLITFLVAVFNLKYYRKVVGRPHNLLKVNKIGSFSSHLTVNYIDKLYDLSVSLLHTVISKYKYK